MSRTMKNRVSRRQGKRVKGGDRGKAEVGGRVTLGALVAAAFDIVGSEVRDVATFLASPDLACAIKRRIVLV